MPESEIQELLRYKIPPNHPIHQNLPMISTVQKNLINHPLLMLLGGHPQAICLASPMLEHQSLSEFFKQLLDSNVMDVLEYQEQSYSSLRVSLNISINNLQKNAPQALELFKFIGLLPSGVCQTELTELWGDTKWRDYKFQLIRASMLVFHPSENCLTLLPFMSTRAIELLEEDPEKMKQFHFKCCKFYENFCQKFLNDMETNQYDLHEFVSKEANLWACIYRGINRKKDNNDFDKEIEFFQDFKRSHTFGEMATTQRKPLCVPKPVWLQKLVSDDRNNHTIQEENEMSASHQSVSCSEKNDDKSSSSAGSSMDENVMDTIRVDMALRAGLSAKDSSIQKKSKSDCMQLVAHKNILSSQDRASIAEFQAEESLVVTYVSICIRLSKLADGFKAITEFNKKRQLSLRVQAHLYQFKGVIAML